MDRLTITEGKTISIIGYITIFGLIILGIVNAANEKTEPLPVIGTIGA